LSQESQIDNLLNLLQTLIQENNNYKSTFNKLTNYHQAGLSPKGI